MMRNLLIIFLVLVSQTAISQTSVSKQMAKEYNNGNFTAVIKLYDKLSQDERTTEILYMVGLSYYNIEDYNNGFVYLSGAINKGKNTADAYYHRGMCNYYLGRVNKSKQDLNRALSLEQSSYYYKEKALIHYNEKEYDTAILLLNTATALDKPDDHALYLRGVVYAEMGLLKEALYAYSLAISNMSSKSPYLLQCYYDIGIIEQYRGNYKESNQAFLRIVQDSTSTDYYSIQEIIQNYHALGLHDLATKYKVYMYNGYNKKLLPPDLNRFYSFESYKYKGYDIVAYENFPGLSSLPAFDSFSKHIYNVYDTGTNNILFSVETRTIPPKYADAVNNAYKYVLIKRSYLADNTESVQYYWEFLFEERFTYNKLKTAVNYAINGNKPGVGFKPYWFNQAIDWEPSN